MHFKRFQQLRLLDINVDLKLFISAVASIDSIATNIPSIEDRLLSLHNVEQAPSGLLRLDALKALHVVCGDYVSFDAILTLVQAAPTLKDFSFNCFTISVSEIMSVLKYSEHLNMLEMLIAEMDMVLSDYNSI